MYEEHEESPIHINVLLFCCVCFCPLSYHRGHGSAPASSSAGFNRLFGLIAEFADHLKRQQLGLSLAADLRPQHDEIDIDRRDRQRYEQAPCILEYPNADVIQNEKLAARFFAKLWPKARLLMSRF